MHRQNRLKQEEELMKDFIKPQNDYDNHDHIILGNKSGDENIISDNESVKSASNQYQNAVEIKKYVDNLEEELDIFIGEEEEMLEDEDDSEENSEDQDIQLSDDSSAISFQSRNMSVLSKKK